MSLQTVTIQKLMDINLRMILKLADRCQNGQSFRLQWSRVIPRQGDTIHRQSCGGSEKDVFIRRTIHTNMSIVERHTFGYDMEYPQNRVNAEHFCRKPLFRLIPGLRQRNKNIILLHSIFAAWLAAVWLSAPHERPFWRQFSRFWPPRGEKGPGVPGRGKVL